MCLSVGFGLGLFSVVFFLSRVFGVLELLWLDLGAFALLVAAFLFLRLHTTPPNLVTAPTRGGEPWPAWLRRTVTVALAIALCAGLYSAIMRTLAHPHGDGWDAFSIWNLHARFLFRGGSHWRDGFTPVLPWSHPDYPLLLPAAIAHFWSCLGHDSPAVPAVIGLLFTFGTVGLLFSALTILQGRMPAMLGATALLATPSFIEQGTSQYADVPLAFFYLATVVLFCLQDNLPDDGNAPHPSRLLVLAGSTAALAAWTKNEGLLFLCAVVMARLLILLSLA
jgi:hypothetical protein